MTIHYNLRCLFFSRGPFIQTQCFILLYYFHVERGTPVFLKRGFQGKCLWKMEDIQVLWKGKKHTPLRHHRSLGCSSTGVSGILDHNGIKDNRRSFEYNTVLSKYTFASSPLEKQFYASVK